MTYAGSDYYDSANVTANVIIRKVGTVLVANDLVTTFNSGDRFSATLKDVDGNPITGVKVRITIGDKSKLATTNSVGRVYMDTNALAAGDYTAYVTYAGSDYYDSANVTANVVVRNVGTVLVANDLITTYNSTDRFSATLTDVDGNAISGVKVRIVIGDKVKVATTNSVGRVYMDTNTLAPGNYKASVTFAGNDYYGGASTMANVVIENKVNTVLTAKDLVTTYNSADRFSATLKDVNGNAISGVKVKIAIGDKTKVATTNSAGKVYMDTNTLSPGNYMASVTFAGNADYYGSNASANVIIKDTSA